MLIPKSDFDLFVDFLTAFRVDVIVRPPDGTYRKLGEYARGMFNGRLLLIKKPDDAIDDEILEVVCGSQKAVELLENNWASFLEEKCNDDYNS